MTLKELYDFLIDELRVAGNEECAFEAKLIFEKVIGSSLQEMIFFPKKEVGEEKITRAKELLNNRLSGEPLQYLLGSWEFMKFDFSVGKGVLIPRAETELLVEYTVNKLKNFQSPVVYDLCSGSGCIGISVKKMLPTARVFMIELSDEALYYLNINRDKLGVARETVAVKGDIMLGYEAFSSLPRPDVILSNPPYIPKDEITSLQKEVLKEPIMALDGGKDGLDFYRCLSEKWLPYLNEGGFIAVECAENQSDDISSMFLKELNETDILNDFADIQRVVVGIK